MKPRRSTRPADRSRSKVILVSLDKGERDVPVADLMDELEMLLENLGLAVQRKIVQSRETEDPATFVGKGKVDELKRVAIEEKAGLIVFDASLTPIQAKNLKERTGCGIWDRPWVIMEVFRRRARSSEAKLQVELARCRYEIPHLKGLGLQMSRTGAGIATRGPGETEFERHRRKVERRIRDIEEKLDGIRGRRENQRKRRVRSGLPIFSLVGYTNAGKSTLFKSLSGDPLVVSKDQLFTTLDTTVRSFRLPKRGTALLTDTVGFLRNLPPALIAAFRATLEEVREADALIWVVDATTAENETMLLSVEETLRELGAWEMPRIIALNKTDLATPESIAQFTRKCVALGEKVVPISALEGLGLPQLLQELEKILLETKLSKEGER
ncbi:MAG: GTPase HflX [Synergistales bacterium]